MPPEIDALTQQVRQILLTDWDPSNASRSDAACSEYDSYINPLLSLLSRGATEESLMDYLHERELERMCFPPAGRSHLRRVAQKLLALPARSTD